MNSFSSTRTGKIARLPHSIRHQLNLRIRDNHIPKSILQWLNNLPEVKTILGEQFNSRPITPQNLSDWKKGGFQDWLTRQDALNFVQDLESQDQFGEAALKTVFTEKLVRWLILQYAAATRSFPANDPAAKWNRLREFCSDITRLRRGDFHSELIQIKRDWLSFEKSKEDKLTEDAHREWAIQNGLLDEEPRGVPKEVINDFNLILGINDPPPEPTSAPADPPTNGSTTEDHAEKETPACDIPASSAQQSTNPPVQTSNPGAPPPSNPPENEAGETYFDRLYRMMPHPPKGLSRPIGPKHWRRIVKRLSEM